MQVQIQEVSVETIQKGRNSYQSASVVHTANGKNSTKKIMSFTNPAVFNAVKDAAPGSMWDVDLKKEGEYWNWVGIKALDGGNEAAPPKAGTVATRPTTSTYETPDERKVKQLYIIRQSSISNALDYMKLTSNDSAGVEDVLTIAQEFVDFVYGRPEDIFKQANDLD
jgi:hypothetical protein